jgi:hypothetical protein
MITKKEIKTESRNQYTSYALSKLSIIFFSTLAVKQNEHNCKRDPIYQSFIGIFPQITKQIANL